VQDSARRAQEVLPLVQKTHTTSTSILKFNESIDRKHQGDTEMPDKLIRVTIRVPEPLQQKIETIRLHRGKGARQIDVWRDAAWAYVNEQENIIGSRAHFQRSLRERIDEMKAQLEEAIPTQAADQIRTDLDPKFDQLQKQIDDLTFLVLASLFLDASSWAAILPQYTDKQQTLGDLINYALKSTHRQEEIFKSVIDQARAEPPRTDKQG
jgi:uncharacterized protein (DUF885 family)